MPSRTCTVVALLVLATTFSLLSNFNFASHSSFRQLELEVEVPVSLSRLPRLLSIGSSDAVPARKREAGPRARPAGRSWGKQLCATYVGGLPATMPALTRTIETLGDRCEWALLAYTGQDVANAWRTYMVALPSEWGLAVRLIADMDNLVALRPHNLTIQFLSKWAMLDDKVAHLLSDYDRVLVRGLLLLLADAARGSGRAFLVANAPGCVVRTLPVPSGTRLSSDGSTTHRGIRSYAQARMLELRESHQLLCSRPPLRSCAA